VIDTPIKPSDIRTVQHLCNAFGKSETEISAGWLVRFAQDRGNWEPFTWAELNGRYQKKFPGCDFRFNGLTPKFIVPDTDACNFAPDTVFRFTRDFVARCFASSERGK